MHLDDNSIQIEYDSDDIQPIKVFNSISINDYTKEKYLDNHASINEYNDSVIIEENDIYLVQSHHIQDKNQFNTDTLSTTYNDNWKNKEDEYSNKKV